MAYKLWLFRLQRKKQLQGLEKELLEAKAEESKQVKLRNLTEITKLVFGIYFKILKNPGTTSKVLRMCLKGLAKFAHCINIEYFVDLINVLDALLKDEDLGYPERLSCIQTVFVILSKQGEVLNLDPSRFYNALYKNLLTVTACNQHAEVATLQDVLLKVMQIAIKFGNINFISLNCCENENICNMTLLVAFGLFNYTYGKKLIELKCWPSVTKSYYITPAKLQFSPDKSHSAEVCNVLLLYHFKSHTKNPHKSHVRFAS